MTATFPGGNVNTFVPSTQATDNLVIDFSRNPEKFPLNKYCKIVPVSKSVGYYTRLTVEEAGRVLQTNLSDRKWADGDDAPSGRGNSESFEFLSYQTERYVYNFRLGQKSAAQASWDILAQHGRIVAQQAMTGRTQMAITKLTTTGNYDSSHVNSDVTTISGVTGQWDASTVSRKDIKRCLDYAADTIRKDTLGSISMEDFRLVISPDCARRIAVSNEIVSHISQSPDALAEIKGKLGPAAAYGLPSRLYGMEVVIEDTVKVTSRKGATKATSYVLGGDYAIVMARPGSIDAPKDSNSAPSFATLTLFAYEEMTVEEKLDVDNRVHRGRVVDDFDIQLTAPISGFLFTDILS